MTTDMTLTSGEPPAFDRRKGCVISAVTALSLVVVGALLLIPAIVAARQAARASQFT